MVLRPTIGPDKLMMITARLKVKGSRYKGSRCNDHIFHHYYKRDNILWLSVCVMVNCAPLKKGPTLKGKNSLPRCNTDKTYSECCCYLDSWSGFISKFLSNFSIKNFVFVILQNYISEAIARSPTKYTSMCCEKYVVGSDLRGWVNK